MSPGTYNITHKQGTTFRLSLTWKDATGATVNLTGYEAKLTVRYKAESPNALLELSTANGKIVLGGLPFNVQCLATRTEMQALAAGQYVYDLEMTANGEDYGLLQGRFIVIGSTVR